MLQESVAEPVSAFQVNTDQDSIRMQGFDDPKIEEKRTAKIFYIFFIKNCNLLIPRQL
jgi:hypothetical protein